MIGNPSSRAWEVCVIRVLIWGGVTWKSTADRMELSYVKLAGWLPSLHNLCVQTKPKRIGSTIDCLRAKAHFLLRLPSLHQGWGVGVDLEKGESLSCTRDGLTAAFVDYPTIWIVSGDWCPNMAASKITSSDWSKDQRWTPGWMQLQVSILFWRGYSCGFLSDEINYMLSVTWCRSKIKML